MNTIERARGRWREILPALGVSPSFLVNKHGPCPICGGRDRYRFDDKDGTGSYFCNQCGAGVGIIMLCRLNDWDHGTACREIDKVIGTGPATWPAAQPPAKVSGATKLAAINRLLAEADDPALVDRYLRHRGLSVSSPALLGHARCPYYSNGKIVGHYAAVIAPIETRCCPMVAIPLRLVAEAGDADRTLADVAVRLRCTACDRPPRSIDLIESESMKGASMYGGRPPWRVVLIGDEPAGTSRIPSLAS